MAMPQVDQSRFSGPASGDWRQRLAVVVETMRAISSQTEPQAMVQAYADRIQQLVPFDRYVSLSRRELSPPLYRITRSTLWRMQGQDINPWKEKHRLPLLEGGILGELLYGGEARIIDDLRVPPDDPAAEHLASQRSVAAIPLFESGVAMNMGLVMREEPGAFNPDEFPELVWMTNLFGRATHNLVLADQVREAYDAVDRELKAVADIQRSLLPAELPRIPTLDLAAHYQTARRAGGDYYDFFPLEGGEWGIIIADVSGHGTPAAVMMAVTHSIARSHGAPRTPPGAMLAYLNRHLTAHYTARSSTFVTAFYGIYSPQRRELLYACAGHNPPRLKRCQGGTVASLDGAQRLPLGVTEDESYPECAERFFPGDQIVFYTDGITEAQDSAGDMFGVDGLDRVLAHCREHADDLIRAVVAAVNDFTQGQPAADDRTLVVAKVL